MRVRHVNRARAAPSWRSAWMLGLTALAVGVLPAPALGTGETESSPDPSGTYRSVAGDHGRSAIEAAVERGIDGLFALARPTARRRLLASNPPVETVVIDVAADTIRIDLGGARDANLPPAAWRPGRGADGSAVQLRFTLLAQGTLKMESRAEGGSARHLFTASADGATLRHAVRIESSHLPDDIRYSLDYRRMP